ncbi:MAG: hypothetical protein A3B98_04235 [Candidatus Taylorbacteria bacterium RIFCSPHIGHO2_02_FULL_43_55]|nr:MAG: hypothetical protein A3B98_04235 [Candidatus Taylorbacteria bacterium RIFCSPHIGHO2_02_FULL_43_55]OHA31052.1 MAG: hypothetical protein A3B09_04180 [Candidatus Taylorbacteria bacterium RIFCSPLOWO2_01_FULL_43_83]
MEKKKFLIVNIGSASKKYAFYEDGRRMLFAHFEHEGEKILLELQSDKGKEQRTLNNVGFDNVLSLFLHEIKMRGHVKEALDIDAFGVRVVAPGTFFSKSVKIDSDYIHKLNKAAKLVPLHLSPLLKELEMLRRDYPTVPIVAVSDSEFHQDMNEVAQVYAINAEETNNLDLRRFGFHGLSVSSAVSITSELNGSALDKVVVCHLGGGSSVTAVRKSRSVDTSMGYTPLEGVPMATRVGNIDAGAVLVLAREMGIDECEAYLNSKCGLLGVSGTSPDIRDLIRLQGEGDKQAEKALDIFVYSIRKYVGAYAAVLGGLDAIIFSGTVGERSDIIRERIASDFQWLGAELDKEKNVKQSDYSRFINTSRSKVKIAVVYSDEMDEIAKKCERLF